MGCIENTKQERNEGCEKECMDTLKDAEYNPVAVKIIRHFITKIENTTQQKPSIEAYKFKNVNTEDTGLGPDKTIDQQIDEAQGEIKKQRSYLLELQSHLLDLQKLKNQKYTSTQNF